MPHGILSLPMLSPWNFYACHMLSTFIDHWEATSPAVFHTTPSKGISFKCQSMAFFMVREAQQRSGWECGQGDKIHAYPGWHALFSIVLCQAVEIVGMQRWSNMLILFLRNMIQYIIDRFSYNIFNTIDRWRNPLVNLIWFGHLHPAEQNQSTQNYFTWAPCQEEHVYIILRAFL